MSNINLSTENISKREPKRMEKSLVYTISFLVLLAVIYVGLIAANRGISSKIKTTEAEYDVEYSNFLSGNSDQVLDFQNRSDAAKKILDENKSMADILGKIESSTLPSIYLNNLKYDKDKKTVSIEGLSDDFQLVAEQILSFKQNDYFSAVIPDRSFVDSNNGNKVNFSLDLIIK